MTRRDFFCALAASAVACGVLPIGFPEELKQKDVWYLWYDEHFEAKRWLGKFPADRIEAAKHAPKQFTSHGMIELRQDWHLGQQTHVSIGEAPTHQHIEPRPSRPKLTFKQWSSRYA